MDPEVMLEKNITMDDINFTLKNSYDSQITCVFSDFNSDKLVFRIRMNEVIKTCSTRGAQKKIKVNPYLFRTYINNNKYVIFFTNCIDRNKLKTKKISNILIMLPDNEVILMDFHLWIVRYK